MNRIKSKITQEAISQYAMITLGGFVFSLGQLFFIKPMLIPMGGVSGIALVMNFLWDLPVGLMSLLLNVPLFFLGWKVLSRAAFYRTVVGTFTSSVFVDLLEPFLPPFEGEMMLAAIYGGILMGAGYGLMFRGGGTSGGTDIITKWLNNTRDIPMGTVSFLIAVTIIVGSALIYRKPESALYAIVTSFASSTVIDKIVCGLDIQKNAMIITNKPIEVSRAIMTETRHSVTAMEATGMYTGDKRTVLLCAVRRHETGIIKRIVLAEDNHAFMMLSNINEVFGENFKSLGNQ